MSAAHEHPWKVSDVVLFPLLGLGFLLEWMFPTGFAIPRLLGLLVGGPVFAFGFWLVRRSKQELERAGQSSLPGRPTTRLVTTGPFAWSRNPNYLGAVMAVLGGALAVDSVWVMATGVLAAVVLDLWMIRPEERYLRDVFGESYADYCSRVRRWI